MTELSRLERIDLRQAWQSEAQDFTPWLSSEENLKLLSQTLGLELELEGTERSVGPFRADILCKIVGSDEWVLVENQLERTDHTHLGQLLTYASGLDAATIIWIAAKFTEEHRATLDWLNRITDDDFNFFGLEVELWRIGESLPAPKFNVVSKPNDWSRSVSQAARRIGEGELSETRELQLRYWDGLHRVLDRLNGPISGDRKAQPQPWMSYSVGRYGFSCNAAISRPQRFVRCELYISHKHHGKELYHELLRYREEVERAFGSTLSWDEAPNSKFCRVSVSMDDTDFTDEADWPRQHEWLAKNLNTFHKIFSPLVSRLKVAKDLPLQEDGL